MADSTSLEVKKERHYTKHLPEQREFGEWVFNDLYPIIRDNIDKLEIIFDKFVNTEDHEISEEDWKFVKEVCVQLEKIIPEDRRIGSFNPDSIKSAKYKDKEKHSGFYFVRTNDHARFALKIIENSKKYSIDDKKELKILLGQYFTIADHIYYFVTAPEK
jgi:hypothetical protein